MKILFLCMDDYLSFEERGTYTDVMREFIKNGHQVVGVSATEKEVSPLLSFNDSYIIKVFFQNEKNGNYIRKGISMLMYPSQLMQAIQKYSPYQKYDAIIFSTPSITNVGIITKLKKLYHAKVYLLLKDIWPQTMVDVGLMQTHGLKTLIYHYFRCLEKKAYRIADSIGCMSQANVDYLLEMNPEVLSAKVHISPNSLEPGAKDRISESQKMQIRDMYGIPKDSTVFLYGGNLGIMQGVDFFVECLKKCKRKDICFVVCGFGTHAHLVEEYVNTERPENVVWIPGLAREEFDRLVSACDIGMAFLSWQCTTPNFPSKMLPYFDKSKPVIVCSDLHTDAGKILIDNNCGWFCPSNDSNRFVQIVQEICTNAELAKMGENGRRFLECTCTSGISYQIIHGELIKIIEGK